MWRSINLCKLLEVSIFLIPALLFALNGVAKAACAPPASLCSQSAPWLLALNGSSRFAYANRCALCSQSAPWLLALNGVAGAAYATPSSLCSQSAIKSLLIAQKA